MRMGIAAGNVLGLLVLHINFLSFEIDETLRGNLSSLCVDYSRRSPPILNSESSRSNNSYSSHKLFVPVKSLVRVL